MSTGTDNVVVVVQLQGDAGAAPPATGGGGGGTGQGGGGGGGPPPVPPPLPGGQQSSQSSASNRWWWLPLMQRVPGAQGLGTAIRTGATGIGVGGLAGAAGVGAAFGLALFSATRALRAFGDSLHMHSRAVEDLANRLAAGPQVQAIQEVQGIRVEMARMRRAERFLPTLAPELVRRTSVQIRQEEAQARIAESIQILTQPLANIRDEAKSLLLETGAEFLEMLTASDTAESFGRTMFNEIFAAIGIHPGLVRQWLRQAGEQEDSADITADLEQLLWVFSPDNPANIDPGNPFNATFGDVAPPP